MNPAGSNLAEDALTAQLRALGAEVLLAPAISFQPPHDLAPLDAALRELSSTWLVAFASARAVERTVARMAELGLALWRLRRPLLAAVGPATAAGLARCLRPPDLMPETATGAALAALLTSGAAGDLAGRRVLLPRPEEARPELREALAAAGALVAAPVAYRTVPASREELQPLLVALRARALDAITFASPSAARALLEAFGPERGLLGALVVASIGPTTSAELRRLGRAPDVEAEPLTGLALAEAVARALAVRVPVRELGPEPGFAGAILRGGE